MGDQIGKSLAGELNYVGSDEISRILSADVDHTTKKEIIATVCRVNALYMIVRAGSGHIGSSFSSMEAMTSILYDIHVSGALPSNTIFFSSKGHDAPALYANLLALGLLDFEKIHGLRSLSGLPGHPDMHTSGIVTNTGSLGMGVSKAKGFIKSARLSQQSQQVIVLTGDGELQEGQFWESLVSAVNNHMGELTIIVDHNKLQSDTLVSLVSDLGDLEAKLKAFGLDVQRCDGNFVHEISKLIRPFDRDQKVPRVIIADTVKGKGVSFMEHTSIDSGVELYKFHSGAPDALSYEKALKELSATLERKLREANLSVARFTSFVLPTEDVGQDNSVKLVESYSKALLSHAETNQKIVALDADLVLDTGLIPFQNRFTERFIECGIAEQDMVSQAGTLALSGILPIVHSFACFLTSRPMEQIYNNATEKTKIVYVGTLAGVIPAGPGHSHQGVRDVATMGSVAGMTVAEPANRKQVSQLLDWAINENKGSSYLRLCSVPVDTSGIDHDLPHLGRSHVCRSGEDGVVITYGPIMLKSALDAAAQLSKNGIEISVIDHPWLTSVDDEWLESIVSKTPKLLVIDNHYESGALMDRISKSLIHMKERPHKIMHLSVTEIPVCGSKDDVLSHHNLDKDSIVRCMTANLNDGDKVSCYQAS